MATSALAVPWAGQKSVGAGSRRDPGEVGLLDQSSCLDLEV